MSERNRLIEKCLELQKENKQLESEKKELLELLSELYESAEYWSDYDVPIGIVDRIKIQLEKNKIKRGGPK